MKAKSWSWWIKIAILVFVSSTSAVVSRKVSAQIVPDTTLGRERSQVTPTGVRELITGGAIRDTTLFHSFREFNVNNGQQVYFAPPNGVTNIFTRVSGSNISRIFGTLGVNGGANLFLMNPNGIIFGPNARLDLRGSFTATTARSVNFDNYNFSATNPTTPPLLKINVTPGLQYGAIDPEGQIRNQGNLSVGQDLNLIGGNLNLQGQLKAGENLNVVGNTVTIRDSTSKPFIATAGSNLVLQGNQKLDIFVLNHPDSGLFSGGDMVLRSANPVSGDAHYTSSGNFRLEKMPENLSLSSPLQQGSGMGSLSSSDDPVIRTGGDVSIGSYTGASLHIIAGGKVEIPNITITKADTEQGIVENLRLSDGTSVAISGNTKPTLDIRAGVDPTALANPTIPATGTPGFSNPIVTNTNTSADIKVGSISFADTANKPITGQVLLTNQYRPNPNLAGDIQINGTVVTGGGAVNIDSKGSITSNDTIDTSANKVNGQYLGNGGDVRLLANGNITFNSSSSGIGINPSGLLAGNVTLTSNGDISSDNANINSYSYTNVPGTTAGDINVTANSVFLRNDSDWKTRTYGAGNAGKVKITARETVSLVDDEDDTNSIRSDVLAGASGNSGGVDLTAKTLLINHGSYVSSDTYGAGSSGGVRITTSGAVKLDGGTREGYPSSVFSDVQPGAVGNTGGVYLDAGSVSLTNGAVIDSSTYAQGNAGGVKLNVTRDLQVNGETSQGSVSGVFSDVYPGSVGGNTGGVYLNAGSVSLTNGAVIESSTYAQGNAGGVKLNVTRDFQVNGESSQGLGGVFSNVNSGAVGNAGGVSLNAGSVSLNNGAQIDSSIFGQGHTDSVVLNVTKDIQVNGESSQGNRSAVSSVVNSAAVGNTGGVYLNAGSLSLTNGGVINTSTSGQSNASDLKINVSGLVQLDGETRLGAGSVISSSTNFGAVGNAGDIDLRAGSLELTNGGYIISATGGNGRSNAGNITINVSGDVRLDGETSRGGGTGISTVLAPGAMGKAGNIQLTASNLSLTNGTQIISAIFGEGSGGDIKINVSGAVRGDGENSLGFTSGIYGNVGINQNTNVSIPGNPNGVGVGSGGSIELQAGSLSLTNGAGIGANVSGEGIAGKISVAVKGDVQLDGTSQRLTQDSGIFSNVEPGGVGRAQGIELTADSLSVSHGAQITSSNLGSGGEAGFVTINTRQLSIRDLGQLTVQAVGSQNAGDLEIKATNATLDNGIITAQTQSGSQGNINLTIADSLNLLNNSRISGATENGLGGRAQIFARSVNLANNSVITTSAGNGGTAGDIAITSNQLQLSDRSNITATTLLGNGGNIILNPLDFLLLRNNSNISTTAGQANAGGNGGNININAGFVVAVPQENSHISANAYNGRGGNINITTNGIYGIQYQPKNSDLSDITATSQFGVNGTVNLFIPEIDPTAGLTQLPFAIIDPADQIIAGCPADRDARFVVTGRGGIPEDPRLALLGQVVMQDFRSPATVSVGANNVPLSHQVSTLSYPHSPIVEATGWVQDKQGNVILVANLPNASRSSGSDQMTCPGLLPNRQKNTDIKNRQDKGSALGGSADLKHLPAPRQPSLNSWKIGNLIPGRE